VLASTLLSSELTPWFIEPGVLFMHNQMWKAKWKRNEIEFHQPNFHPLLQQFLPQLHLTAGEPILVPLCGKSLDLDLLAASHCHVIGIEISPIAIAAYFASHNIKPQREKRGRFIRWSHQQVEIWCGDIFDLTAHDIGHIRTLYDCTSLTAFSPDTRPRYIQHFHQHMAPESQIMLITSETPDAQQQQAGFAIDSEVQSLYQPHYDITLLHGQVTLMRDPENPSDPDMFMEEKVYLLKHRAAAAQATQR